MIGAASTKRAMTCPSVHLYCPWSSRFVRPHRFMIPHVKLRINHHISNALNKMTSIKTLRLRRLQKETDIQASLPSKTLGPSLMSTRECTIATPLCNGRRTRVRGHRCELKSGRDAKADSAFRYPETQSTESFAVEPPRRYLPRTLLLLCAC
jgi:hypothetical protein